MAPVDPELVRLREALWNEHPVITCSAVVDTPPAMRAYALVKKCGRRSRGSLAFWAHPLCGKTSCIRLVISKLRNEVRPVSVFYYECNYKQDNMRVLAEGAFLEDFLTTIDSEIRVERSLSGKRNQVKRKLYAMSVATGKLFIVLDEAQGLDPAELCWLKTLINWLATQRISVITVLFGQQELLDLVDSLVATARSDLQHRFVERCYELDSITKEELAIVLDAYDISSAYPADRSWSYTQFLWPQAFAAGFRLSSHAKAMWEAFALHTRSDRPFKSVSMDAVAQTLSALADATKDRDSPPWRPTPQDWADAVIDSGFPEDLPTRDIAPATKRQRPGT